MNITQFLVLTIYITSILSIFGLVVILLKGLTKRPTRFLLLILSLLFWLLPQFIAQFIAYRNPKLVEILIRSSLLFAGFVGPAIILFIKERVVDTPKPLGLLLIAGPFLGAVTALPLSPLTIDASLDGIVVSSTLPFYIILTSSVFLTFIISIVFLTLKIKSLDKIDQEARALRSLRSALGIAVSMNIVGAFLLAGYQWSQVLTPLSMAIMAFIIYVSIFRHHLFDVRSFIARSLGYILTFGTLIGIYVIAIFGISTSLLGASKLTTLQQLFYFAGTLVFGFTLQPLRKFFDKLTNRLFYRDAYDSQELLDKLNKILVGNIDLQPLLRQTSEILETTLKAEFAAFIIKEVEGSSRRVIGSKKVALEEDQISDLSQNSKGMPMIIMADELDETHAKFKGVLSKNKVSVLARLAPTGKDANVLGYLVLGSKQSGNPYNKQDLQVLDIIANELVIAVQNAMRFEEIEAFTVTLQEKVNDATRQLRRTNEKLKALDETKDEFISMASHQLRTPLTAVKGYVSMVVEGDAGKLNKQQKELLDQAFSSSQRMVYLIADLLNVSRLKTGKFVIENKLTNLADVVEAEIEQLKQAAAGKNQTLTYNKPAKFIDLMLDETKMRQVIMNFTDNALHYTPKDGHINVSLQDLGNSIEFTVVDDGLGVPKSEQHNLFTKFFRANNARRARPDGTGLGLFMAKKVVVAQGGAIIFTSQEGKGSTFGFTLPKNSTILPHAATDTKIDTKPAK